MIAMPIPRIVQVTNVEGSGEKNLYQIGGICNGKSKILNKIVSFGAVFIGSGGPVREKLRANRAELRWAIRINSTWYLLGSILICMVSFYGCKSALKGTAA